MSDANNHVSPICGNCRFCIETRLDPNSINRQRVCNCLPPQIVAIPGPQGVQMMSSFPIVTENMSCAQFRPLPGLKATTQEPEVSKIVM